jgi:hypothetical protein
MPTRPSRRCSPSAALRLFGTALDLLQRAGQVDNLVATLADLALLCSHIGQLNLAVTLHGVVGRYTSAMLDLTELDEATMALREVMGHDTFDQHRALGSAMPLAEAVQIAREQIRALQDAPASSP